MNTTIEYNFGTQLKYACQLFRFYSSVILVIVGKKNKKLEIILLRIIF
jgi:hypothetical protein